MSFGERPERGTGPRTGPAAAERAGKERGGARIAAIAVALVLALLLAIAGRASYLIVTADRGARQWLERSEQILERARSFDQRQVLARQPRTQKNGPFFRFDEEPPGPAAAEDRASEPAQQPSASALFALEFEDGEPHCLTASPDFKGRAGIRGGVMGILYRGEGFLECAPPAGIPIDEVGEIEVRARVQRGNRLRLGWSARLRSSWDPNRDNSVYIDVIPDGGFRVYRLNAKNILKRGAPRARLLRWIYLEPSSERDDRVEIDFIRFHSKMDRYLSGSRGTAYETLGREMRAVLYMTPPRSLSWTLDVPLDSPLLDFGIGMLKREPPIRFTVRLGSGGDSETLFSRELKVAEQWQDVTLDLSRWQGSEVEIWLEVDSQSSDRNVAFWSNPVLRSAPRERFNVILYLEDTLRSDRLSGYGYGRATSPVKDRFAEQGIRFHHPVSQATKTRPSVASMMTSLLPTATGVWTFSDYLSDRYLTLAEIMRAQGFKTASFIQNGNAGPFAGLHQGFGQVFDAALAGKRPDQMLSDRLYRWLETSADSNFFLYIHILDPHGPYEPPEPHDAWFRSLPPGGTPVDSHFSLDPKGIEGPTLEGRRSLYDGEILNNDSHFSRFLDWLDRLGLRESTLIVFLSDHGEHLGEHGLWEHHPPGYLQVTGVPVIVALPRGLSSGAAVRNETVQLLDILPTVLDAAGIESEELLLQGDSLLPLIRGEDRSRWRDRLCLSEEVVDVRNRARLGGWGSAFFRKWHLIRSRRLVGEDLEPSEAGSQLFDFVADRQEESPIELLLLGRYLERRLERFLTTLQQTNLRIFRALSGPEEDELRLDPDVQDQLRALGYLK